MFEAFSSLVTYVADVWQPQVSQEARKTESAEEMMQVLNFLKRALVHGGPMWPHTPNESDVVIENLRLMAKVLQAGRKDGNIVECFMEQEGRGRAVVLFRIALS